MREFSNIFGKICLANKFEQKIYKYTKHLAENFSPKSHFRKLSSDSQQLEALIQGFADRSQNKTFLPANTTSNFLAIRPSGNPITAQGLAGMYDSDDWLLNSPNWSRFIV